MLASKPLWVSIPYRYKQNFGSVVILYATYVMFQSPIGTNKTGKVYSYDIPDYNKFQSPIGTNKTSRGKGSI